MSIHSLATASQAPRSTRDEVLEIVREIPGVTSAQVIELMPHAPVAAKTMLSYLEKRGEIIAASGDNPAPRPAGLAARGWRPKVLTYRINPIPGGGDAPARPKRACRRRSKGPTEAGLQATVEMLRQRIAELEAWQARAIERFPDLAVPAHVIQARKAVAAEVRKSDPRLADEIDAGRKDETLMVRVAIRILEDHMA